MPAVSSQVSQPEPHERGEAASGTGSAVRGIAGGGRKHVEAPCLMLVERCTFEQSIQDTTLHSEQHCEPRCGRASGPCRRT
jgi:hypothetical protein